MKLVFAEAAWEDYLYWQKQDRRMVERINKLIREGFKTIPDAVSELREAIDGFLARCRALPDAQRAKVDEQIRALIAAEPEFSENQLARALIAAKAQGIEAIIVLNKLDLGANFDRAWTRLLPYQAMGYTVLAISASPKADLSPEQQIISNQSRLQLEAALKGKSTLVLGPSGTGKSTIINQWVPTAGAHTQEISKALNSGKHTTTSTTLYWIDAEKTTAVLDSPGFLEFGLHHISAQDLDKLMPDFAVHVGNCRFYNCTHRHEPQCAVTQFRQAGTPASTISEERYRIYNSLYEELSRSPH